MPQETYHPNAYLTSLRNVSLGLRARTKILDALEKGSSNAKKIADQAGMRYSVVMHHLKLLGSEGVVRREGGKPSVWTLTGAGQKRLINAA